MLNVLFLLVQIVVFCSCYEVTPVGQWRSKIGDSAHYDAKTNSLYYTDAVGEYHLLRYDLTEKRTYKAKIVGIVGRVGFVLPIEGSSNEYLIGNELDLKVVKWDGKSRLAEIHCTQMPKIDVPTNFIHDAKADSQGRLYVGTLRNAMCNPNSATPPGALFQSVDAKNLPILVPNMTITNDFAIDEVRNILYVVESCSAVIKAFDWDPNTAGVSNERIAVDFHTELLKEYPKQIPDSVKLDTEGKLWVTANGAGAVVRFDPDTGKVLRKIQIPVIYTQSLAFGGKDMDILFVTTNSVQIIVETGRISGAVLFPPYGSLYQITGLGVKGVPAKKLSKNFATCATEKRNSKA